MNEKGLIQILGAAGTVTGSKYLIESQGKKFLVDCGLFQGLKELRLLNWNNLPLDVSTIDFILLTHGHLDHVGYLPRVVQAGFKGKIYGTAPSLEIAEIVLKDTGKIQEEEAEQANRHNYSKHVPAKPLYDLQDVGRTIPLFTEIKTDQWIDFGNDIQVCYHTNGHIIGSAFIEIHIGGKKLVFSGDIGPQEDILLYPPNRPKEADILFVESTYGDRLHPKENVLEHLKEIIQQTVSKGGTLIIPSFAVERTQTLMYLIWQLKKSGALPDIPLIMDSPMGASVLEVFDKFREWLRLPKEDFSAMTKIFQVISDYKETVVAIKNKSPKIVIAGSGMLTGGRVLNYLQEYIGKKETTLLMVGYQAEGTRGRQLQEGAHEVKIYGKYYTVNARIETIKGLSAHADQNGLLQWLSEIKTKPERVMIIHGEKQVADTFRVKIKDVYGWDGTVPKLNDIIEW
jgi:metallo-beta-lactamase family protein